MKLADYLDAHNLSQAKFAELIGVDRSTVGRWLKPKSGVVKRPDWNQLKKIDEVTGGRVTPNDFVDPPEVSLKLAS